MDKLGGFMRAVARAKRLAVVEVRVWVSCSSTLEGDGFSLQNTFGIQ